MNLIKFSDKPTIHTARQNQAIQMIQCYIWILGKTYHDPFQGNDLHMKSIIDRQVIRKVLVFGVFYILLISMFIISGHIKNAALNYVFAFELVSFILIAITLRGEKYIIVLFIIFYIIMSGFCNPLTLHVVTSDHSVRKLSASDVDEVYVLSFKDGSTATMLKKNGKWECIGSLYANEQVCRFLARLHEYNIGKSDKLPFS